MSDEEETSKPKVQFCETLQTLLWWPLSQQSFGLILCPQAAMTQRNLPDN